MIYMQNQLSSLLGAPSHLSDTSGDLAEEFEDDYQQGSEN